MAPTTGCFVEQYRSLGLSGGPWDAKSIDRLEKHLGLPIPAAYRAYLEIAGSSPPTELIGSDCHGSYLFNLREWAIELLSESAGSLILPDDAIVFLMHQGYQFFYIRADGKTADPPVFYYFEGWTNFKQSHKQFSDWVATIV